MSSSSTASCHILFCGSCSKRRRKVRRSSRRNAATRSSGLSLISRGPVSETTCSASRILSSMLDLIGPGPSAISDSRSRSNVSIMKSHFPIGVFPPYFDRVPSNFGSSAMLRNPQQARIGRRLVSGVFNKHSHFTSDSLEASRHCPAAVAVAAGRAPITRPRCSGTMPIRRLVRTGRRTGTFIKSHNGRNPLNYGYRLAGGHPRRSRRRRG